VDPASATLAATLNISAIHDYGFTNNVSASLGSTDSFFVAVRIPSFESKLLFFDSPTSTGVVNVTGAGFEPEFALLVGGTALAYNTGAFNSADGTGVGMAGFDASGGIGFGYSNAVVDPTDTNSTARDDQFVIGRTTNPRAIAADWDGFTSDGFDLDFTAVHTSATKCMALVLGHGNIMESNLDVDADIAIKNLFNAGNDVGYSMMGTRGSSWNITSNGATRYLPIFNADLGSNTTTEADALQTIRRDATFSKLCAHAHSNLSTGTTTVRLRKNGGNGNMVVSIPALATGFFIDDTNTDSVTAGDTVCFSVLTGSALLTTLRSVTMLAKSASGNPHVYLGLNNGSGTLASLTVASRTGYFPICGQQTGDGNTTDNEYNRTRIPCAGTVKNMQMLVTGNARGTDTVIMLRKNGADTSITFTVPAATTGTFEDTTNSESVAANDTISYRMTTGTGTGSFNASRISCLFESTNNEWPLLAHSQPNNTGELDDRHTESYHALMSRLNFLGATVDTTDPHQVELEQILMLRSFYASRLSIVTTTKTGDNFVLRLNADMEDLTNVVTVSTTGFAQDVTNEDEVPAGSKLCARSEEVVTSYDIDYVQLALVLANET